MYVETDSVKDDVWALSQLGNVINAYVDREVNKATRIEGTTGYGVDEYGRMYALGQPLPPPAPPQQPVNGMLLLLVLAAVFISVSK